MKALHQLIDREKTNYGIAVWACWGEEKTQKDVRADSGFHSHTISRLEKKNYKKITKRI